MLKLIVEKEDVDEDVIKEFIKEGDRSPLYMVRI